MTVFPNWPLEPLEPWPEYLPGWEPHHLLRGRREPRRWRAPGTAGHDNNSITALHVNESCNSISLRSFATLIYVIAEIWATWPLLLGCNFSGTQVTQCDCVCIYLLVEKLREPAECSYITDIKLTGLQRNHLSSLYGAVQWSGHWCRLGSMPVVKPMVWKNSFLKWQVHMWSSFPMQRHS